MKTYRSQPLINQFIALKKDAIDNASVWQNKSEQVQNLSALLHKFYLDEVQNIANYHLINDLIITALKQLSLGHEIYLNQKLELQYNNLISVTTIPVYTPSQLVAMYQEEQSDNEMQLLELFMAQSDIWLAINLGLYLQSQNT